jgi:hypothetical protein
MTRTSLPFSVSFTQQSRFNFCFLLTRTVIVQRRENQRKPHKNTTARNTKLRIGFCVQLNIGIFKRIKFDHFYLVEVLRMVTRATPPIASFSKMLKCLRFAGKSRDNSTVALWTKMRLGGSSYAPRRPKSKAKEIDSAADKRAEIGGLFSAECPGTRQWNL